MKHILRCLLALLALSTSSLFAQVTVTITGTIVEVSNPSGVPYSGPFVSIFPLGTPFTATFTYDPTTVDSEPAPTTGYYQDPSAAATFSAGAYTFSTLGVPSGIYVFNNATNFGFPADGIDFPFGANAVVQDGGFRPTYFGSRLLTANTNLFSNDSLANITSGTWVLNDFQYQTPYVSIRFLEGGLYGYASSFSFSTAAVPEPSTYAAIAGLGALGLVCWRRWQARTIAHV